ncbi:hypothetical protein ACFXKX_35165 [Streptomyces scopuliridis]|uniref:hypothetical protein n=1 Tax=Streptomyces scopuliridis TaxID=452529 RepID=UPI0036CF5C0F
MLRVEPQVRLVARPQIDYGMLSDYLAEGGGRTWLERLDSGTLDDAQNLAEFAGRVCYRSWVPA